MQSGARPLGGKINELADLLWHETTGWIDDANRNRIGLVFSEDTYERSNGEVRGSLIRVEPRHAAACNCRFCSSIGRIDRNLWDNGHALLFLPRRPEQPGNRATGRGGGYAVMLQEALRTTEQPSSTEIAGAGATNRPDFAHLHGNQRRIGQVGNSHSEIDVLFHEICDKIREEEPRRDVRMAGHEITNDGQN